MTTSETGVFLPPPKPGVGGGDAQTHRVQPNEDLVASPVALVAVAHTEGGFPVDHAQ